MFARLPASGMREANPNRRRHTGTAEAMESSGAKSVGFGSVGGRHSGVGATPLGGRVEGNPEVDAKSLVISFRGKTGSMMLKRVTETCQIEVHGIARRITALRNAPYAPRTERRRAHLMVVRSLL